MPTAAAPARSGSRTLRALYGPRFARTRLLSMSPTLARQPSRPAYCPQRELLEVQKTRAAEAESLAQLEVRVATLVQAKAMAEQTAATSAVNEVPPSTRQARPPPPRPQPLPPPPPPPPPPPRTPAKSKAKPLSEAEVAALLHAKAPAQISGTQPEYVAGKATKAGAGGAAGSALGSALELELSGTGRGGLHVPKQRVTVKPGDVHGRARHSGNIGDLYVHEGECVVCGRSEKGRACNPPLRN